MEYSKIIIRSFLFLLFAISPALGQLSPASCIHAFVKALNQGKFHQAYSYFSKPLREEFSYPDFREGAEQVKQIRLLKVKITSLHERVARAKIVVEGLEKSRENQWHKKRYAGEVVLIPEGETWKLIQVNIYHLKKYPPKPRKNGRKESQT